MNHWTTFFGAAFFIAGAAASAQLGDHEGRSQVAPEALAYLNFVPKNANGSFDGGAGDTLVGWEIVAPAHFAWQRTSGTGRTGSQAVVLRGTRAAPPATARLQSVPLPAREGDILKFNGWLHASGTDLDKGPELFAEAFVDGAWIALSPIPRVDRPQVAVWFPLGSSVVLPQNTTQVRVVATLDSAGLAQGAQWHLDDFHCTLISLREYVKSHQDSNRLPDFLLLGVDTLRQSPLGCYGSTTGHTPNIDLLAREGALFRHAMTCSPWTRPSFASIFTSLYPSQHTAELHNSILPGSLTTLAELLQAKGYFTAAFVKTRFDGFVGPGTGFAKGFDVYVHAEDETEVTEAFNRFLSTNGDALSAFHGGLFIFRHFYEPHATYVNRWPGVIVNEGLLGSGDFNSGVLYESLYRQQPGVANAFDIEYALRIYESEAHAVDTLVGETLAPLRYYGLYGSLNIILCSDHGEAFNEKPGAWNHGTPYNTCTEVPLIMRLPGRVAPGTRVDQVVVSNLDIMPTILETAGIAVPGQVQGQSLLRPETVGRDRLVVSEDRKSGSIAIRDLRYKLVAIPASLPRVEGADALEHWKSLQAGVIDKPFHKARHLLEGPRDWVLLGANSPTRFELYDLDNDPFENHDIAAENVGEYRRLLVELLGHCAWVQIYSLDDIKREQQFGLSAEELVQVEALATRAPLAEQHVPSSIDLAPDTLEALVNQGYF